MKLTNNIKKQANRKKKGFTLIEIIVAVTIVIILSALAVPRVSAYISKAKEASAISAGKQIFTAAMWSYSENNDKFDVGKVTDSVEKTSNVKLSATSPVTVDSTNNKSVTINFESDKKPYILKINGDSNSYTIEDNSESTPTPVFDSSK